MRVFDHPNMKKFKCPICGKKTDSPVVLVARDHTVNDGIAEADQVHLGCLELMSMNTERSEGDLIIYQIVPVTKKK